MNMKTTDAKGVKVYVVNRNEEIIGMLSEFNGLKSLMYEENAHDFGEHTISGIYSTDGTNVEGLSNAYYGFNSDISHMIKDNEAVMSNSRLNFRVGYYLLVDVTNPTIVNGQINKIRSSGSRLMEFEITDVQVTYKGSGRNVNFTGKPSFALDLRASVADKFNTKDYEKYGSFTGKVIPNDAYVPGGFEVVDVPAHEGDKELLGQKFYDYNLVIFEGDGEKKKFVNLGNVLNGFFKDNSVRWMYGGVLSEVGAFSLDAFSRLRTGYNNNIWFDIPGSISRSVTSTSANYLQFFSSNRASEGGELAPSSRSSFNSLPETPSLDMFAPPKVGKGMDNFFNSFAQFAILNGTGVWAGGGLQGDLSYTHSSIAILPETDFTEEGESINSGGFKMRNSEVLTTVSLTGEIKQSTVPTGKGNNSNLEGGGNLTFDASGYGGDHDISMDRYPDADSRALGGVDRFMDGLGFGRYREWYRFIYDFKRFMMKRVKFFRYDLKVEDDPMFDSKSSIWFARFGAIFGDSSYSKVINSLEKIRWFNDGSFGVDYDFSKDSFVLGGEDVFFDGRYGRIPFLPLNTPNSPIYFDRSNARYLDGFKPYQVKRFTNSKGEKMAYVTYDMPFSVSSIDPNGASAVPEFANFAFSPEEWRVMLPSKGLINSANAPSGTYDLVSTLFRENVRKDSRPLPSYPEINFRFFRAARSSQEGGTPTDFYPYSLNSEFGVEFHKSPWFYPYIDKLVRRDPKVSEVRPFKYIDSDGSIKVDSSGSKKMRVLRKDNPLNKDTSSVPGSPAKEEAFSSMGEFRRYVKDGKSSLDDIYLTENQAMALYTPFNYLEDKPYDILDRSYTTSDAYRFFGEIYRLVEKPGEVPDSGVEGGDISEEPEIVKEVVAPVIFRFYSTSSRYTDWSSSASYSRAYHGYPEDFRLLPMKVIPNGWYGSDDGEFIESPDWLQEFLLESLPGGNGSDWNPGGINFPPLDFDTEGDGKIWLLPDSSGWGNTYPQLPPTVSEIWESGGGSKPPVPGVSIPSWRESDYYVDLLPGESESLGFFPKQFYSKVRFLNTSEEVEERCGGVDSYRAITSVQNSELGMNAGLLGHGRWRGGIDPNRIVFSDYSAITDPTNSYLFVESGLEFDNITILDFINMVNNGDIPLYAAKTRKRDSKDGRFYTCVIQIPPEDFKIQPLVFMRYFKDSSEKYTSIGGGPTVLKNNLFPDRLHQADALEEHSWGNGRFRGVYITPTKVFMGGTTRDVRMHAFSNKVVNTIDRKWDYNLEDVMIPTLSSLGIVESVSVTEAGDTFTAVIPSGSALPPPKKPNKNSAASEVKYLSVEGIECTVASHGFNKPKGQKWIGIDFKDYPDEVNPGILGPNGKRVHKFTSISNNEIKSADALARWAWGELKKKLFTTVNYRVTLNNRSNEFGSFIAPGGHLDMEDTIITTGMWFRMSEWGLLGNLTETSQVVKVTFDLMGKGKAMSKNSLELGESMRRVWGDPKQELNDLRSLVLSNVNDWFNQDFNVGDIPDDAPDRIELNFVVPDPEFPEEVRIEWEPVTNTLVSYYELHEIAGPGEDPSDSNLIYSGLTPRHKVSIPVGDTKWFAIRAINYVGVEGEYSIKSFTNEQEE